MTPDELAAIEKRHVEHPGNHIGYACGKDAPHCWEDDQYWPCDARRLLDELNRETRAITEMAFAGTLAEACAEARQAERQRIVEAIDAEPTYEGMIHRDRLFAIVEVP